MKESTNNDDFKNRLKSKMDDSPVFKNEERELWSKVIGQIEEEERIEKRKVRKIHPLLKYASAASLIIGLASSIYFWNGKSDNPSLAVRSDHNALKDSTHENTSVSNQSASNKEKITTDSFPDIKTTHQHKSPQATVINAKKKVIEYDLPDGSHLTLNKGSMVKWTGDFKRERILSLQGEAYFEIEPDKNRPFSIYFNNHRLLVVGTKFHIRNMPGENNTEVSVTEGVVMVFPINAGKGVKVSAGEQLQLIPNEVPGLIKVNPFNFISWKTGILNFKNATMEEVSLLMSRKYEQAIHVDPAIAKCTFTGEFTELNLDEAIKIIEITTSFKVEKRKHEIYISGESCK